MCRMHMNSMYVCMKIWMYLCMYRTVCYSRATNGSTNDKYVFISRMYVMICKYVHACTCVCTVYVCMQARVYALGMYLCIHRVS